LAQAETQGYVIGSLLMALAFPIAGAIYGRYRAKKLAEASDDRFFEKKMVWWPFFLGLVIGIMAFASIDTKAHRQQAQQQYENKTP
jgi:hypothetical protein